MSPTRSTPTASRAECWRLRYSIDGYAAAGTPVLVGGTSRDDPDEITVIVDRRAFTLPPYYLLPPASTGWHTPERTEPND